MSGIITQLICLRYGSSKDMFHEVKILILFQGFSSQLCSLWIDTGLRLFGSSIAVFSVGSGFRQKRLRCARSYGFWVVATFD